MTIRHVLGLSGGRDSAALAVFMRQRYSDLDIEYFFTDTGKELPEVYEYLIRLEGYLGKPIRRLNPVRNFDYWLKTYNNYLPSAQSRWCTRQLKLKPFEDWVQSFIQQGDTVISYVAIRSDEEYRQGYKSGNDALVVKLPLKESGIDKEGVMEILEGAGLDLPKYYDWRSRSGCTFCFFQQKIEWIRLKERHPEAFDEAKRYEKTAVESGSPFTWSQGESLTELEKPERQMQIRKDYERRLLRSRRNRQNNPLRPDHYVDNDELYGGSNKACLTCHK